MVSSVEKWLRAINEHKEYVKDHHDCEYSYYSIGKLYSSVYSLTNGKIYADAGIAAFSEAIKITNCDNPLHLAERAKLCAEAGYDAWALEDIHLATQLKPDPGADGKKVMDIAIYVAAKIKSHDMHDMVGLGGMINSSIPKNNVVDSGNSWQGEPAEIGLETFPDDNDAVNNHVNNARYNLGDNCFTNS